MRLERLSSMGLSRGPGGLPGARWPSGSRFRPQIGVDGDRSSISRPRLPGAGQSRKSTDASKTAVHLTTRLIRHILLPAIVLAIFVGAAYHYYNRKHARASVGTDLTRACQLAAELLDYRVDSYERSLTALFPPKQLHDLLIAHGQGNPVLGEDLRKEIQAACEQLLASTKGALAVEMYDASGQRLVCSSRDRGFAPADGEAPWFAEVRAQGRSFSWEDMAVARITRELTDVEHTGTLFASMVFDFAGVAEPTISLATRGLGPVDVALCGRSNELRFLMGDPLKEVEEGLASTFFASFCEGTLRMHVDESVIEAEVNMYEEQVVTITSLIFFVLVCSIWIGLRDNVLLPVETMIQVAEALERGEKTPSQQSRRRTGDELDVLDQTLRSAADTSLKAQELLNTLNRTLEQRVDDRTRELRTALDAADAASRAKSTFLNNMGHEVRTPLNGILGMTDPLLDSELDGEQREAVELIRSSGEQLLKIINDILDIACIQAGKLTVEHIPYDLLGCLEGIVSKRMDDARRKGLDLSLEVAAGVPRQVLGDPGRFRQVLVNLVDNAIKFTDDGSVRIRAGVVEGRDGRELVVQVKDTGVGIPAAKLHSIFEPFAQGDDSPKRRFGGAGLGLAISRHLVAALGGRLTVESELGRGTSFTVALPLALQSAQASLSAA